MSTDQTTALVLRTVEFSETSLILTLLTRDFGQVSALAKGARRPKSPFEGSLDLLAVCRVVLIRKSTNALDLLTEAKLHRRFRGAEHSLERVYAGYYVAEMLRLLTDNHDPHPELYDLSLSALGQIDGIGNVPLALLGFDIQTLRLLGHAPTTATCCDCGGDASWNARCSFAPVGGGVVCSNCRSRQHQTISVSRAAIEKLDELQAGPVAIPDAMSPRVYAELRGILSRYIQTIVGLVPRMQAFLPGKLVVNHPVASSTANSAPVSMTSGPAPEPVPRASSEGASSESSGPIQETHDQFIVDR